MKISPNGKMVGILSNTDMYIYNLQSGNKKICFSQNEEYLNQSQKNTITTHQLKSLYNNIISFKWTPDSLSMFTIY